MKNEMAGTIEAAAKGQDGIAHFLIGKGTGPKSFWDFLEKVYLFKQPAVERHHDYVRANSYSSLVMDMKFAALALLVLVMLEMSFSATFPSASMERIYELQKCSVEYQNSILEASLSYGVSPPQEEEVLLYTGGNGRLFQLLGNMENAEAKSEFNLAYAELSSEIRSSTFLYSKIMLKHAFRGESARAKILSDHFESKEAYYSCRFCLVNPNDPECIPESVSLAEEVQDPEPEPEPEEEPEEEEPEPGPEPACDIVEGSETAKLEVTTISEGAGSNWDEDSPDEDGYYHAGENQLSMLEDFEIVNSLTGRIYLEVQEIYALPEDGEFDEVFYSVLLDADGGDGLPLCAGDESTPWDSCDDLDRLTTHKVFIMYKGEEYVISEIDSVSGGVPYDVSDEEAYEVDGAEITLSKQESIGIIQVNETLPAQGDYAVRLDWISEEVGPGNSHAAVVSLLDSGEGVCQEEIYPGETIDLCGEGVLLHAYQTAPGLNPSSRWAELAIYSEEIELESGSSGVTLLFTSKGGASEGDDPEYIREILSTDDISYWEDKGLSAVAEMVEETSVFTLHEGESVGLADGMEVKVRSIDQQLTSPPACKVVAVSETVEIRLLDNEGEWHKYILHEGEEAAAEGITVKVLRITEEVTTN